MVPLNQYNTQSTISLETLEQCCLNLAPEIYIMKRRRRRPGQRRTSIKKLTYMQQKTQNVVISRCCFAENGKEMYKDLWRTYTAIVVVVVRPSLLLRRWGRQQSLSIVSYPVHPSLADNNSRPCTWSLLLANVSRCSVDDHSFTSLEDSMSEFDWWWYTAIVLLINSFVQWRFRFRCRRGFVNSPIKI